MASEQSDGVVWRWKWLRVTRRDILLLILHWVALGLALVIGLWQRGMLF